MKKLILILAAIAAFASASAESIKLSINQAFTIAHPQAGALVKLDAGVSHVITKPAKEEGGEPEKIVVQTAYDFPAATRLAIYRNRRALADVLDDFDKARIALVKKTWGDRTPSEKDPEAATFAAELARLAAEEVKVEITRLKAEDLLRNGNPIPSDVLLALQPILTEK